MRRWFQLPGLGAGGRRLRLVLLLGDLRLRRVRLVGVLVFVQALLELPNAFTEALADAGKPPGAEDQEHDNDDDEPVDWRKTTHVFQASERRGQCRMAEHVDNSILGPRSHARGDSFPRA